MIQFKEYESKPIRRRAFQLTEEIEWYRFNDDPIYLASFKVKEGHTTNFVKFIAHEEPKLGDWVIDAGRGYVYHCTEKAFRELNVIPGVN